MPTLAIDARHAPPMRVAAPAGVYYPALDGLRAIAFLMVFFQHYCSLPWGWTGVNIFFVLSGFLITGILWDTREDPHRARNFYLRRTLRIFPLYYGIWLVALLVAPFAHWRWSVYWLAWPLYLGNFLRFLSPTAIVPFSGLYVAGNGFLASASHNVQLHLGHFWSLCVEEQFYLIWPWVVFRVRRRQTLVWICAVVVPLTLIARLAAQHLAPIWMLDWELLYRFTPFQLDSLLLGGLIGLLWRGGHRERIVKAARVVAALATALAVVYLARTLHLSDQHWPGHYVYPPWRLTWGLSFLNVFSAAIILCALQPSTWTSRILSLRPLRWIGRISYGAYVLHDLFHSLYTILVFRWIVQLGHSHSALSNHLKPYVGLLIAAIGLSATLLLAWLSFRFYETPFLRLKDKLAPKTA
jgi:peptidoglycan/LPS O-acetylase OafA/YrhL